jgi:hypothetical protein
LASETPLFLFSLSRANSFPFFFNFNLSEKMLFCHFL